MKVNKRATEGMCCEESYLIGWKQCFVMAEIKEQKLFVLKPKIGIDF